LVVDVGGGGDPTDDGTVVGALGDGADQVPAETAVAGAAEPHLAFESRLAAEAAFPVHAGLVAVVGVKHLPEGTVRPSRGVEPTVLQPGAVPVIDPPLRVRRPDALGHRVQQAAVAVMAFALSVLARQPVVERFG